MKLLETPRTVLTHSSRTFVWSATAFGLLVLFSFFAAIGYDFYLGTLQSNEQAANNVAALTEQNVARDIELYDLSLRAVIEGVADPEIMAQRPVLRQKTLFDRSATAQGLGAMVALDRDGAIFADSLDASPRRGNFSDREYFIIHRDSPTDIGLYVSRPFQARLQNHIWSVSVSRRISRPDGSFGGIVSGTIKLDYFRHLFNKVALGTGGSIVLLRDDGTLIVRNEADDDKIGDDWSTAPVFAHLPASPQGSFISNRSMDGVSRLYAYRRVGDLPLVVIVGLSLSQVLAPWWSKIQVLAAIFAIMATSVLVLVWLLEAELRRRASAEMAAAQLARTDGLTKLANRRAFEEALTREWARAAREARPVSLLMIDVDHFKRFNDTYGHQAGDQTLAAVAGVIQAAAKRPAELAARIGGEEFAVLLPNTDRRGAMHVAESIRKTVCGLRIDHAGSEHRIVTISVGVAAAAPRIALRPASFMRDADAALYRAKGEGRNATCAGDMADRELDSILRNNVTDASSVDPHLAGQPH